MSALYFFFFYVEYFYEIIISNQSYRSTKFKNTFPHQGISVNILVPKAKISYSALGKNGEKIKQIWGSYLSREVFYFGVYYNGNDGVFLCVQY